MGSIDPMGLPEVIRWKEGWDIDLDLQDFVTQRVSIAQAVAVSSLMFPDYIEVQNCIILRDKYDHDNFIEWWDNLNGDAREVEKVINHTHLWELFDPVEEIENQALEMLARQMAICWRVKAESEFPGRRFDAVVTNDYGPTVTISSVKT